MFDARLHTDLLDTVDLFLSSYLFLIMFLYFVLLF